MRSGKRRALFALASAALVVLCRGAGATQPPNYQKYIIGERALGMGGAYAAAVDDPIAAYYNPGGMVFAETTMLSASKALYSLDYRFVRDGFIPVSRKAVDAITLEHRHDLYLPSTLAVMFRLGPELYEGGPKRHALGISVVVPYQDEYTLKAKWEGKGSLRDSETYSLSESYRIIWTGLSYAYRINREWGIGLSLYLDNSDYERSFETSRIQDLGTDCPLHRCGYLEFKQSDFDMTVVSLIFHVGVLWVPNDRWRFALTVTPQNIQLGDLWFTKTAGSLDQTAGFGNVTGTEYDYVEYFTDTYGVKVAGRRPTSFRLGAAFLQEKLVTVDLDLSVHLPTTYNQVRGDPVERRRMPEGFSGPEDETASPEWFDPGVVRRIVIKPVANLNLGSDWIVAKNWNIRFGVFSDFSSAPEVTYSDLPQRTKVDRLGGTFSFGYISKGFDVTIGVTGNWGWGKASVQNFWAEDPNRLWQPAYYEERSIYVFFAGIQKAVATTAKRIYERIKEKQQDRQEAGAHAAATPQGENPGKPVNSSPPEPVEQEAP